MPGYAVNEKQSKQLATVMADLSVEAEADAVFMTDYGGNIIAHVAQTEGEFVHTLAALAAGSFCATRELASLIGEPTFHSIFHQGQRAGIYIQSVGSNFLIFVIFGKNATPGLVKLYVEKASKELEPVLQQVDGQSTVSAGGSKMLFEINEKESVFKQAGAE